MMMQAERDCWFLVRTYDQNTGVRNGEWVPGTLVGFSRMTEGELTYPVGIIMDESGRLTATDVDDISLKEPKKKNVDYYGPPRNLSSTE